MVITASGAVLALWSLTWILRAQRSNPDERQQEVDARERVARGEGWDGAEPPRGFTDAELRALAEAQRPMTLEEAGVVARPLAPVRRRGGLLRRR